MISHGVKKIDTIAIVSPNDIAWLYLALHMHLIGYAIFNRRYYSVDLMDRPI